MTDPQPSIAIVQSFSELDDGRTVELDVGQGVAIELVRVDDEPWTGARSSNEERLEQMRLPEDWGGPEPVFMARSPGTAEIVVEGPAGSWRLSVRVTAEPRRRGETRAELPADAPVTWDEIVGRRHPIRSARGIWVESRDGDPVKRKHFAWDEDLGWSVFDDEGSGGVSNAQGSFLVLEGVAVRSFPPGALQGIESILTRLRSTEDPRPPVGVGNIDSVEHQTIIGRPGWVLALSSPDGRSAQLTIDEETGTALRFQSDVSLFGFEALEVDVDVAQEIVWRGPVDESREVGRAYISTDPATGLFSATLEQDGGPVTHYRPLPGELSFDEALALARQHQPRWIITRIADTSYDFEGSDPRRPPFPLSHVRRSPTASRELVSEVSARTHWMRSDAGSAARWVRTTIEAAGLDAQRCALAVAEREQDLDENWPMTVIVAPDHSVWICDEDLDRASRHPDHAGDLTDEHSERWQHMRVRDQIAASMTLLDAEREGERPPATPADS